MPLDANQVIHQANSNTALPFGSCFHVTAFNPAMQGPHILSASDSFVRLAHLQKDLADEKSRLSGSTTFEFWPSYGIGKGNWREDGYAVGTDSSDKDIVRSIVLRLALKYGQGAIHEYESGKGHGVL